MIDLKQLAISPATIRLGIFLSQHTPDRVAHHLNWWAAGALGQLKPAIYRVVEDNLRQVLGPEASEADLARTSRQVFCFTLRSYFDLFRALELSIDETRALVDVPQETIKIARSLQNREGGSVLICPHLSNFDMGGHALVPYMPEMQLLTLPDPPPGFELLNETRQRSDIHVTPLTPAALRHAIRLLKRGGILSTAGDRPVSDLDEPVSFFGRPARMPSGHVRLALKTGAVLVVGYCLFSPDTQRYSMQLEQPMELIRTGNPEEELQINLRRVLDTMEAIIRRWPEQWLMFVPVWPEPLET